MPRDGVKRFYRSGRDKIIAGVCGGLGEYFGVDPVIIRLLWIGFCLMYCAGIAAYILAWIFVPKNPRDRR
jgi:phage shock protein C